ncbi:MAG TPA: DivIVA domain-containing protein [Trebonia sp.]|jgi:DivIVA domain-containing protein
MDDLTAAEAAIARIRGAKFRTTRWDGYDADEVDDFLDEMIAQLSRGDSVPGSPVFTRTRLRPGYRTADVDALLREFGI